MKYRLLDDEKAQTFALIFEAGDEVISTLEGFAKENNLIASHFTAIGAFREVTLGYFERQNKRYKDIPISKQVEVVSLVGNITISDSDPKVHAHVVVADESAHAYGGHLLSAVVDPTLEVVLIETPRPLRRKYDPDTGLALISIPQSKRRIA